MLSICILNYNGKDYIEECLSSIPNTFPSEKILVDNNSTDESWKIAEKYGFKVIHADNKYKFITGINTAIASANSDYILFSQGDVKFGFQCIERLSQVATCYGNSIIQPLFIKDGKIDNAGMKLEWPGYGIGIHNNPKGLGPYETDIATSITFLISRDCFERVGYYDEKFSPAYYEDMDWAIRSKKVGIKHIVARDCLVFHRHNESFSKEYSKKGISDICRRNRKYVIRKHYRGIDKWLRLAVTSCLDIVKEAIDIITDWRISANNPK